MYCVVCVLCTCVGVLCSVCVVCGVYMCRCTVCVVMCTLWGLPGYGKPMSCVHDGSDITLGSVYGALLMVWWSYLYSFGHKCMCFGW